MNSLMQQSGGVLKMTQALRHQLQDILTDQDLSYSPGGNNLTLGALYKQLGETTQSYITAFKTFKQDWTYRNEDSSIEGSVDKLHDWLTELEQELNTVFEQIPEETLQTQMIERGFGMQFPIPVTFHVYREALLIFCGKASIYLMALEKELPEQWNQWIG